MKRRRPEALFSSYSRRWPALGAGEEIGSKIDTVVIAHGLFTLIDAFPFRHADAREASVSIPVSERLFAKARREDSKIS
jgi:hypothetical protein